MSTPHLTDLALDLASDGFGGHEQAVRGVVRSAREHGVTPTLVAILADPRQPEVARLRAFGRVAAALAEAPAAPASARPPDLGSAPHPFPIGV